MENKKEMQKLIKRMLKRHSNVSKALQYEFVAEELGVTSRYVRYIEAGEGVKVKAIEKLIKIMA